MRLCLPVALLFLTGAIVTAANPPYPRSRIDAIRETLHGVDLPDPYRWLEEQQSPETRRWIDEQNRITETFVGRYPGRAQLAIRLGELMRVESLGTPSVRGNRYFFNKQFADRDLPVICLRERRDSKDEILLDPQELSRDGSKTVSMLDISKDGKLLVYAIREGGEDEVAIRFFDVDQRRDLEDCLDKARYFGVSLTPDKKTLYYTRHGKEGSRVYRRPASAVGAKETYLFGEGYDPGVGISPSLSEDGKHLVIGVWHGSAATKAEIFVKNLETDAPITPIVTGIEARFSGHAVDQRMFVQTNWNSPNGRVLQIDLAHPEQKNWKEIIPEQKDAVLEGFSLVGGRLYVNYLQNVVSRVRVFETAGTHVRDIQFPSLGTVGSVGGEWDRDEAYFGFSSYHIPFTTYREDVKTGRQEVWSRMNVPFDSDKYEVKQVWYVSKDKTKVPMFLIHRKGMQPDGNRPTLINAYGGFNISLTPSFSTRAVAWIENGGVFAVPNLRGGGEFGEEWHRAGMLANKQNVFDDFIAAAEWLIDNKYTSRDKLAITGRSNGGLLVGAALTQRPDLYRAVICGYPLLDMVRYHKFLVARFWIPEYGSSDDPEQFKTLLAYSPYHNVKTDTKYPAVLFVTGDADTRVDPLHARKMAALLQAKTASDRPILLKYDTKLGHTGARPVSQSIEDVTDELCFLFEQLGVETREDASGQQSSSQRGKSNSAPQTEATVKLLALFAREWEWTLREDPLFASHLGDRRYNDRWPDVSLAAVERQQRHCLDVMKDLDAIDIRQLTDANRVNYQLFRRQHQQEIEAYPFQWYTVPLNQRDGIQDASSIADQLRFASVKDYEDWLSRLRTFPAYMEQTVELMREGIKQKVLQTKVVMERVPAQIQKQIVSDPEQSLYFKPFRKFPEEIAAADQKRLVQEAKRLIAERIIPSYKSFADFFNKEYLPACYDKVGIWQAPRGREFYEFRARQFTTTKLTPKEIHEIGLKEVARIRAEMEEVIRQVKFKGTFREFLEHLRTDPKFYYKDPNDLLLGYQALCKRIDPQLPKLFKRLPRIPYGVEPIPDHIAPDTTTAYYRQPSADGSRAGTYFVNLYRPEVRPKYEMEALSLHEAVPGHHLQIAIATELDNVPQFRRFTGFTAFVEGWGLYAERLGADLGCYQDPYSRFGQLTYEMWRAVRLVVDTGMHTFEWPRQRAIDFFKENTAKTELDIVNEVDRYISWPGQALAYKIGEMKIGELRARAAQRQGDKFDLREFHDVVLRQGAVPLDVLEETVEAWLSGR